MAKINCFLLWFLAFPVSNPPVFLWDCVSEESFRSVLFNWGSVSSSCFRFLCMLSAVPFCPLTLLTPLGFFLPSCCCLLSWVFLGSRFMLGFPFCFPVFSLLVRGLLSRFQFVWCSISWVYFSVFLSCDLLCFSLQDSYVIHERDRGQETLCSGLELLDFPCWICRIFLPCWIDLQQTDGEQ